MLIIIQKIRLIYNMAKKEIATRDSEYEPDASHEDEVGEFHTTLAQSLASFQPVAIRH